MSAEKKPMTFVVTDIVKSDKYKCKASVCEICRMKFQCYTGCIDISNIPVPNNSKTNQAISKACFDTNIHASLFEMIWENDD